MQPEEDTTLIGSAASGRESTRVERRGKRSHVLFELSSPDNLVPAELHAPLTQRLLSPISGYHSLSQPISEHWDRRDARFVHAIDHTRLQLTLDMALVAQLLQHCEDRV